MNYLKPLLPLLAGWALLLWVDAFYQVSLVNGVGQLLLFAVVVCIPAWKTGKMSYVDIGWPSGLMLIGLVTLFFSDGHQTRVVVVSMVYLFIGGRMAWAAIRYLQQGHLDTELPRYQYQRIRWERAGIRNTPLIMQVEVLAQGLANASFLAFPAFVIGANRAATISAFEIAGLLIWAGAFVMETLADRQKHRFIEQVQGEGKRNEVCNVGLWRYSRHPNYFAEWMVWNGLVIAAVPSWLALGDSTSVPSWVLLGLGLLFVSRIMYMTLVYFTGAKPSEYYSVQKRPDYKHYQETTNMFFPGPVKTPE